MAAVCRLSLIASLVAMSIPYCTCFQLTPDILTQFGLMNKISTGYPMLDILLCLMVPVLMQKVVPKLHEWVQQLLKRPEAPKTTFKRSIIFKKNAGYYWYWDDDDLPTSILQDAVLTSLNDRPGFSKKLPDGTLELRAGPEKNQGDDSDDDSDDECYSYKPFLSAIVSVVPACGVWTDLGNGVHFMRNEGEDKDDEDKTVQSTTTTYHFTSDEEDGSERIESLIQTAFEAYKAQQRGHVDHTRYLYMPVPPKGSRESKKDDNAIMPYKRYALSEERTFASLFHPDKKAILQLIDNFLNKTGKFAIPGYPQKLGFLLHGPPGTGKTSFIKALAQYTKRNIVNIPLANIKTNQELTNIMFDQKFGLSDEKCPISLPFNKTIFVMEDVDAASDVVLRRSEKPTSLTMASFLMMQKFHAEKDAQMGPSQQQSTSTGSDPSSPPGTPEANKAGTSTDPNNSNKKTTATNDANNTTNNNNGNKSPDAKDGTITDTMPYGPTLLGTGLPGLWGADSDALNLAGLLNILDGVVDTPGRIIIMTSNHPEKLDPALIRPGRINRQIYLGRLRLAQGLELMRHYFGEVGKEEEAVLSEMWVDELWSPAEVEALCAECDNTEQLVQRLQEKLDKSSKEAATSGADVALDDSCKQPLEPSIDRTVDQSPIDRATDQPTNHKS